MKPVLAAALLAASPSIADTPSPFVEANLLSIFYHELGHAVIDIHDVPIFAQEEDAVDVFSIFLIDALFEPEAAEALTYDAAAGFWAEAEFAGTEEGEIAWWDTHSPDERRFYNTVCLFYGADVDRRESFAEELGLPNGRAETCEEEYALAADSWESIIDEMVDLGSGGTLSLGGDLSGITGVLLVEEVKELNEILSLSTPLKIVVENCGEANAFYDSEAVQITMCAEFEAHLHKLESVLAN